MSDTPLYSPLRAYRLMMLAGAAAIPAFWGIYQVYDPGAYDPLWARLVGSAACLAVFGLTHASAWARDHVLGVGTSMVYLIVGYFSWLCVANGLDAQWGVGLASAYVICSMVIALYGCSVRWVAGGLSGLVLIVVAFLAWAHDPGIPRILFAGYTVVISFTAFVAGVARLQAIRDLSVSVQESEEKERLLRTVIDTIPDYLFVNDDQGRAIMRNQSAASLLGYDATDQGLGLTVFDLLPEERAQEDWDRQLEILERGAEMTQEEEELVMGDESMWLLGTRVPLRDPQGNVTGIVGLFRDVTAQKAAEAMLHEAKEEAEDQGRLLQTVIDTIPDMIFVTDRDGRCIVRNLADARAIGYERPADTLGLTVFDTVGGDRAQELFDHDQALMASGEARLGMEEAVCIGGEEHVYRAAKVPLRDEEGEVVGLVGVVRDVTIEKRAQDEIEAAREAADEQQRLLRTIIDTIPDHVYVKDLDGRAILRNAASAAALGYDDPEAALGKTDADLDGRLGDEILRDDLRVVRDGETVRNKEEQIADGEWLLTTKVPLRDLQGETVGLVGVSRDITEQKVAETELIAAKEAAEAATQAKSEFLANMSHEIRTPMNGVIGMTSLLLGTPLDGEQRDFVETIRTSGDALLTIINDILDFSKIEAGMMDIEERPFDVRRCIEETLDLIAPRAAEKGIELAYLVEDGVPASVVGDVTRVRQVLVNLLSNAVKFTSEGSVCIRVEARPPDTEVGRQTAVWFSVEDTGIGIAGDKLAAVFEAFSQADASTTRRFGGTGLGLTICSRLVDMMGGEIEVESVPGEGSTFRFSVVAEVAPSERRVFLRPEQPALEGRRVLVIDDNAVNREILTRLSSRWRMLPEAAASGADGLAAIEAATADGRPFDLVLLDMQMPEMDGFEVARALRSRPDSPVIVMLTSIHQGGSFRADARAAGVHQVLYKPTKPSQLYDTLIGVFGERAPEPETAWVARPRSAPAPEVGDGLRILLAEDNAVNQKVALRLLERLGHRADLAANGVEAVEAVHRQAYDVVLMDVQMPEMDGLEATHTIRAAGADLHQPRIVALTANAMEGDRERCLEAGCDDYLAKPVVVESLREALERASLEIAITDRK